MIIIASRYYGNNSLRLRSILLTLTNDQKLTLLQNKKCYHSHLHHHIVTNNSISAKCRSFCTKYNDNDSDNDKLSIRVVTYNVLSPSLCTQDYYPTFPKEYLDPKKRLLKIMNKINKELSDAATNNKEEELPVIFCLQEVSREWSCNLLTFFSSKNYQLVTGLYGGEKNGFMGVCIAYPMKVFRLIHVDNTRLSETRDWPRPSSSPEEEEKRKRNIGTNKNVKEKIMHAMEHSIYNKIKHFFLEIIPQYIKNCVNLARIDVSKKEQRNEQEQQNNSNDSHLEKEEKDHWDISERKHNILLFLKLYYKPTKQMFGIATYHMPCSYLIPKVMTIHIDMAMQRIQQLTKTKKRMKKKYLLNNNNTTNIPFIFAGDFNFLPNSYLYSFITTGKLRRKIKSNDDGDDYDSYYPTSKYGMEWKSAIENGGLDSVYALSNHGEPNFTNYSKTKINEFIGTLDYVFISKNNNNNAAKKDWNILQVKPTLKSDEEGPYPNNDEPSDHIMISADLQLLR